MFCQELTGILPSTVESAQTFRFVFDELIGWLKTSDLIDENLERKTNFAFATCGNFDLGTINNIVNHSFYDDSENSDDICNGKQLPIYFNEWINVKKTFVNHKKEWPKGLYNMLAQLGKEPTGRLHSAIDDCKNLASVIKCLHQDGCVFYVTDFLKKK